jgi:hypothetical protein
MGISSATALGSIAIDVMKDSPADVCNRALQALGLKTHDDVRKLDEDIAARERGLATLAQSLDLERKEAEAAALMSQLAPSDEDLADRAEALATEVAATERTIAAYGLEIQDRENIKRTFEQKVKPFVSEGLLKDLTTDLNGVALHRLQALVWTLALGVVFVIAVYRDWAMPADFSPTLLALMGISGAGYVGFKYPERNN